VPTLLETQRAMRASLVDGDDRAAAALLADDMGADRFNIYRNTFVTGVTKALRLTYPAVHRLVGAEFFEGAAAHFIAQHPPRAAWLDEYGEEFPDFLAGFQPAASLAYLADVARLEWAVSRAIHAADVGPLDLTRLAALSPEDQARVCFVPHPSVALLCADYPADAIWRGVLSGDDAALAGIDPDAGPVRLLVERRATGVEVSRLDEAQWCFAAALCDGWSVSEALAGAAGSSADALLAEHLAVGRFVDFHLAPVPAASLTATHETEP
jgi:putative DNA-binding protein